jgi:UDP-N-acetylglucosamine transferase subunit ALG13
MVPLARAFLDRDDEVLWTSAAEALPRLEAEGFRAVAAGLGEAEGMARFAERFSAEAQALAPQDRPLFMFPRIFGSVRAGPMLADLLPVVREWQPNLIVHDAADLAAPIAAATIEVPSVNHGFGGLLPRERVAAADAVVAPLWEAHGLEPRPYGGCYDHLYLDIFPPSLSAGDAAHVPEVQPLRPVPFATAGDEPVPEWLLAEDPSPLVYVTFGTVFNQDLSVVATVVDALRDLPLRVLVTLGPRGEPDALGPQPANVHVARYIPQTEVLPRTTVVVSHAGSGTFLAALSVGLPHLCLPRAADQFDNAAACVRSGCGLVLQPSEVDAEGVRVAVERLLGEEGFRAAAARLRGELGEMPAPDEVAGVLSTRFG